MQDYTQNLPVLANGTQSQEQEKQTNQNVRYKLTFTPTT